MSGVFYYMFIFTVLPCSWWRPQGEIVAVWCKFNREAISDSFPLSENCTRFSSVKGVGEMMKQNSW